jgi:hypothetical protein
MSIEICKECSEHIDTDFNSDMALGICRVCLEGKNLAELYILRDEAEMAKDEASKDYLEELIAEYE